MAYKKTLKSLVPPVVLDLFRRLNQRKSVHFSGTYPNWETVEKDAKGYDSVAILQQAVAKTQLVVSGKATYERDGVVFDDNSYPYQLLTILLRAATENNNNHNDRRHYPFFLCKLNTCVLCYYISHTGTKKMCGNVRFY